MSTTTDNYETDTEITLYDSSSSLLKLRVLNLALTKKEEEIIDFKIKFVVKFEIYQYIDNQALFNLNRIARIAANNINFQPDINIYIEACLKPEIFTHLLANTPNSYEALIYLQKLPADNPILLTENWLGLSVKQFQECGEIGYHTFWSHFSNMGLSVASSSQEQVSENISNFIQDLVSVGLDGKTPQIIPESMGEVAKFLRELSETDLDFPKAKNEDNPIYAAIINFFTEDDWGFEQSDEQLALHLVFEGNNGILNCYAQSKEKEQQFIFYSVVGIKAPENKRQNIAEFIARANYGMIIGNFELDFNDGEIRYKTSIDVDGDRLSFALIKNLVYANVTMMDEYLPGIINVIENGIIPTEAINQIENL